MSKREIVLLVSRAIAVIQLISVATTVLTILPRQILMLFQYQSQIRGVLAMGARMSPSSMALFNIWQGLGFSLLQILVQLLFAFAFWKCGPTVERLLLPAEETKEEIV
jgi:hypothetical protein